MLTTVPKTAVCGRLSIAVAFSVKLVTTDLIASALDHQRAPIDATKKGQELLYRAIKHRVLIIQTSSEFD